MYTSRLSELLAVPAVQVDHIVPVSSGLSALLELELEGVEVLKHLVLVVMALPSLILFYSNLLCFKFINYFKVFILIICDLLDHLVFTSALSLSLFCYNYYD